MRRPRRREAPVVEVQEAELAALEEAVAENHRLSAALAEVVARLEQQVLPMVEYVVADIDPPEAGR